MTEPTKDTPLESASGETTNSGGRTKTDERPTSPFTRAAIRSVMPRKLPPTPGKEPSISARLRHLLERLVSRR